MRITTLILGLVLLTSACSHRNESVKLSVAQPIAVDGGKPHFRLVAADLAAPAVIRTNGVGSGHETLVIHFQLSAGKAAEFARFTQEHLRQQAQLICDSTVVAEPFVATPISDGRVQIAFSSLEQARGVEGLLNKKQ